SPRRRIGGSACSLNHCRSSSREPPGWNLPSNGKCYDRQGRVAQRESTRFTPGRPQVQPLPRPPGWWERPGGASKPPPLYLKGGIRSEGIVSEFTSAQDPEGSPHPLRNYHGYSFIVPASQLLRTRSLAFDRFQINLGGKHAKIEQDRGAVSGNGCRPHRPNYRAGTSRDDADLHRAL